MQNQNQPQHPVPRKKKRKISPRKKQIMEMQKKKKRFPKSLVLFVIIVGLAVFSWKMIQRTPATANQPETGETISQNILKDEKNEKTETKKELDKDLWKKPTGGEYPDLTDRKNLKVLCKIKEQRVYIYDGNEQLYKMIVSTGEPTEESKTPEGHFVIERERGEYFFNHALDEGALYYVSFKDHGIYLFHSVPVNQEKEVNVAEAEKLGQQVSHGCIRLSMPDAKWFYDNIPEGIPVIIEG